MKKKRHLLFWILFPILATLAGAIIIFYFDLANGPMVFFVFELAVWIAWIMLRIIFRDKRFIFRFIPTAAFFTTSALLFSLAQPTVERKSAAYYSNPIKTEVMTLENGKVQGVLSKDKAVQIYAGIPYAKPPVGDLRWKEPQDVENWEGVLDCGYFAPRSMQPGTNSLTSTLVDIYSSKGWYPDYEMHPLQNMSEDSLYLNIWRPNNNETNLPILVFIHGGSLTSGSSASEDFNGEEMAKKGVIMITIQYRLGVFGYFAHSELKSESPNHTTGNYGLLDQIKALKWISKNAAYFGGDKDNITVAGESAGSSSVSAICASPLAGDHLFKRAIGESSSLVVKSAPHTYRKYEEAVQTGYKIMKEFNCSSIEELRKIPAKKLLTTKYTNSEMTLDGYALTKTPYEVYEDGENNEEALLNGYNIKEADAFVIPTYLTSPTNKNNIKDRLNKTFGKTVGEKIYNLYKDRIEKDAFNVFNEVYSVFWFIQPHHSWSNMALNNGETVYRYQFTKENKYHGTFHAGEMIYAYGNVKKSPHGYRYDDSDRALSETMLSYWANFAKTGNPNGENLPTWNTYNSSTDNVMELGSHVGPIADKYLDLYPLIEEYINSLNI